MGVCNEMLSRTIATKVVAIDERISRIACTHPIIDVGVAKAVSRLAVARVGAKRQTIAEIVLQHDGVGVPVRRIVVVGRLAEEAVAVEVCGEWVTATAWRAITVQMVEHEGQ